MSRNSLLEAGVISEVSVTATWFEPTTTEFVNEHSTIWVVGWNHVAFTFSVFDRKYHFWVNLVQKIKIINLSWNLVLRLIRIWRIQWWCSFFLFSTRNTLCEQIWSKKSKLSVSAEISYLNFFEYAQFNSGVHFFCFRPGITFLENLGQKIVSLSWN